MSSTTPIPHRGLGSPATRWVLVALIALAAVVPPETRGDALAGCAALSALLVLLGWRGTARAGHAGLALALLLLVPAVRLSMAPGAAVEPVAVALVAAALGLVAARMGRDEQDDLEAVTVTLGLAGGAVGLHAVYQRLWGIEHLAAIVRADPSLPDRAAVLARLASGRAFAGFATPAAMGGFLALTLPLAVALAWRARGRRRAGWIAVALIEGAAFLAAASATAAAALLLAAAAWAVAHSHSLRTRAIAIAFVLLILLGVSLQRDRVVLRPGDPTGPWRLRLGNLQAAWSMAADHPWSGVGPGAFGEAYPAYRRPGDNETRHVHNLPLEFVAELGWPAGAPVGALWLGVFVGPLLMRRRRAGPLAEAAAVGLASFALHNLADFTGFMPSILWPAAVLRGLIARGAGPAVAPMGTARSGVRRALARTGQLAAIGAAAALALNGLSRDARWAARRAAFTSDFGAALALAEQATRLAPWDADAASMLAKLTVDAVRTGALPRDQSNLALARADRAVRISPLRPPAREARAAARLLCGDAPGAYADLAEAARLHPLRGDYAAGRDGLHRMLEDAAGAGRRP